MSAMQIISNQAISYVNQHFQSRFVLGCSLFGAASAIEMIFRATMDVKSLLDRNGILDENGYNQKKWDISGGLGGSLFYLLCASNYFSRAAEIGAAIYVAKAVIFGGKKDTYYIEKAIHKTVVDFVFRKIVVDLVIDKIIVQIAYKRIWVPIWNNIIHPILNRIWVHIIKPLAETLIRITEFIFKHIFTYIKLPEHPIWYIVAGLIVATAIKKVYNFSIFPNISFQSPIKIKY